MNKKLSIIIPFVNEYPQVAFTIRSISEALLDKIDFEIIAVSNFCKEVADQGQKPDTGHSQMPAVARMHPWLRYFEYTDKLSHWQAKNLGVAMATGDTLWFCDAHCVCPRDDLVDMFRWFVERKDRDEFTLHLPLTYLILEKRRLKYSLRVTPYQCHYTFCSYRAADEPTEVPCMSTCGMMMSKKLLVDNLGGWPPEMGIYGGGENFINFVLAVLGKKKFIWPAKHALFHHGAQRNYSWNYTDYLRNRAIATYMYSDKTFLAMFLEVCKGRRNVKSDIYQDVIHNCRAQKKMIERQMVISIADWVYQWQPGAAIWSSDWHRLSDFATTLKSLPPIP